MSNFMEEEPLHAREILRRVLAEQNLVLPPKGGVGKETSFRPRSAAEILSHEPEPISWVWELFLPEGGLVVLTAYMKVGKSTFAYALAVAVAQGRSFLGFPTKQGPVLILAVEEHPRDVYNRLRRFGMRLEDPIFVHAAPLDNTPSTLASVRNFIREKGIKLVVLDTLGRYWGISDENSNAEVLRRASPLLDLAHDTGAVVLLVHHQRKSGGEEGRGIRGASALLGLVDQALLLERRQGGKQSQRVLRTIGRYSQTPKELILEFEGGEYRVLGTPREASLEAHIEVVLTALKLHGPQSLPSLVLNTGLSEKQVKKALDAFGDRVKHDGKGVRNDPYIYRLSDPNSILPQPSPIGEETNTKCLPAPEPPLGADALGTKGTR